MSVEAIITFNNLPHVSRRFPAAVGDRVREQLRAMEGEVKQNIVKYGAVDSGEMLRSVRGDPTGQYEGTVSVDAVSEAGFPYPLVVNSGSVFVAPRPFFTEAIDKARRDYPVRFSDMEGSLV